MGSSDFPTNPPPYTPGPTPGPAVAVQPSATIVHTSIGPAVVPVVVGKQMGPKPTITVCSSCNQQIQTRVETKATMRTHLFALILCLVGCWPCAVIPYCVDTCNNADHYCPYCNSYIGSHIN